MSNLGMQARIIAALDLIVCIAGIISLVIGGVIFSSKKDDMLADTENLEKHPKLKEFLQSPSGEQASYFVIPAVYLSIELALALILWMGVSQNKGQLLKTWMILTAVMLVVGGALSTFGVLAAKEKGAPAAVAAVGLIFNLYSLWVVFSLSKETEVAPA